MVSSLSAIFPPKHLSGRFLLACRITYSYWRANVLVIWFIWFIVALSNLLKGGRSRFKQVFHATGTWLASKPICHPNVSCLGIYLLFKRWFFMQGTWLASKPTCHSNVLAINASPRVIQMFSPYIYCFTQINYIYI